MKIKMADAVNPMTKILWLKGPNKDKFDWMKMDMIKKLLTKDRDILVLANKTIRLKKGTGYWLLERYPWGGDFHRLLKDVDCTDYEVIHRFIDGTPSQIIAVIDNKRCGFQL